jgi:hypothetical protein
MRRGLESGLILGDSKGVYSGLKGGLQGAYMTNKSNMINPSSITDPKVKPVFYINADNVALVSNAVSIAYNLVETQPNDIFIKVENIFTQLGGTTYRPPIVFGGLGGKNYMQFGDTSNRIMECDTASVYSRTSPNANATGFTYIFIIKRVPGGTRTILDARDSPSLAGPGDLLLEVNAAGRITFDYKGGFSGTTTSMIGTAGVNLLDDWSILTVKCQLRTDGGHIPNDGEGPSPVSKRFAMPANARVGSGSALDVYVNSVEQYKTLTTNTFTVSDYFGDDTYRMLNRPLFLGNRQVTAGTSGTHIAAAMMIPAYISNALQTKIENYFRYYYNRPF